MPARYAPVALLGQGGGGEVWQVRDRATGRHLALKVLAEEAGELEAVALVREAVTLSGLEGLGVPRVVAFGRVPESARAFLVRELVEGRSFEQVLAAPEAAESAAGWLVPLIGAAGQLTILHRAGLLHGDVKPGNIIVGPDGAGTLVDLGLATPLREGGARARGLTPRYAAPEVLAGEPVTVRAEVFALGATLQDALDARGAELDAASRAALTRVAERATRADPAARHPSVDELASAMRRAARVAEQPLEGAAWPVLGAEGPAQALASEVARLAPGEALAIHGPPGSGRSTLVRRLAWSLGVSGAPVAMIDATSAPSARGDAADHASDAEDLVALELDAARADDLVIVIDAVDALDGEARDRVRQAAESGARLVAVGDARAVAPLAPRGVQIFGVPPLDEASAAELMKRALPSLPDRLAKHLFERTGRRPGPLRAFVERLAGRAVTSTDEIDALLGARAPVDAPPRAPRPRPEAFVELARALDTGRFDEAADAIGAIGPPEHAEEAVELAIARARVALARGDATAAADALDAVEDDAVASSAARRWQVTRARTHMRAGDVARAAELAERAADAGPEDATAADALAVRGVALAFLGDEQSAAAALERSVAAAERASDPRVLAVALVSRAIAHQRAGRADEARRAYEAALDAAEEARDAWTLATTRLNLAGLAKADGDLARALVHLEGALDMGRRAGGLVAVEQALFNLANLDLYLGRYERASASIETLSERQDALTPSARAQLLGLQAELAARAGEHARAARLYTASASAYDDAARPLDAAEAALEGLLTRLGSAAEDAPLLARELDALRERVGEGGFKEHEALFGIVRGSLALARGDEATAREALDEALARAERAGQQEWAWRALEARARLGAAQGALALARRDLEAALALLEETAAKLPRDLREVFWNDPRRRALRDAHAAALAPGGRALPHDGEPAPTHTSSHAAALASWARSGTSTGRFDRGGSVTSMGLPVPADDRLARIFEITRDLARERELDQLLELVTDHAVALTSAERGLIVLVGDRGELTLHVSRSSARAESHETFSRSVAERVIRDGEPVIATSARDDERLAHAVSVHQLMIQSIACVPIHRPSAAKAVIGALYLETRLRPGSRFRAELPTLAAFADQAAIAIESARLIDENRRRAEELAVINAELESAKERLAERLGARTEQLASARRDLKKARRELRGRFGYAGLVGTSAAMRRVYALLDRIKDTDVPVLVTGESGTGKEVIAKALHAAGPRRRAPFLGVNCGAIPAGLLESELFGHVRGAFTGADRDRKGLFREAAGGTLLLDEIGEMPLAMQAGLLRVLQERRVRPVGGAEEEACDARVVAATNRDLSQMVAEGSFREDLFYRLHVIELRVPPLRERAEDIPLLVDHFLTLFATRHQRERRSITRDAVRRLQAYDWPGNVRQLEHTLLNAWLLADGDEIDAADLDLPAGPSAVPARAAPRSPDPRSREEHKSAERERILDALSRSNWNRVKAAELVGIPRRTFYRRLKEYDIL